MYENEVKCQEVDATPELIKFQNQFQNEVAEIWNIKNSIQRAITTIADVRSTEKIPVPTEPDREARNFYEAIKATLSGLRSVREDLYSIQNQLNQIIG